jgi:HK97 family phage major capsid protein
VEYLRKLKDGNGRYLWQDNQQDGEPSRLHGRPITINQDMDSTIAAAKKTLLYGQLSKYKIRSVGGVRLYRLQERFRDNDEDGFIAFIREDGNLLDAGTKPVKVLLH